MLKTSVMGKQDTDARPSGEEWRCPKHGTPPAVEEIDGETCCHICGSPVHKRSKTQTEQRELIPDGGRPRDEVKQQGQTTVESPQQKYTGLPPPNG